MSLTDVTRTSFGSVGVEWSDAPEVLRSRSLDRSGWAPDGLPSAVFFPRSPEEVQRVVRFAGLTRTSIVARGAGTALTGAATAGAGAIVLDLSRMNRIVGLDAADGTAVVEPGVITAELDRAALEHGLRYAPDPASLQLSTIGGNIATNAGGLRCAKYGATRDSVLGLDVVLASGELISTGRSTFAGVAGYDLTSLFVGSEGTLGVVVGATVRLRPLPPVTATLAAAFADVPAAAAAAVALTAAGVQPALAELLDAATLEAIDAAEGTRLRDRGEALLIVQLDGVSGELSSAAAVLSATATQVRVADNPAEADALLAARRAGLPAIERLGRPLIEDIAVPRSRMADAIAAIASIAKRHDVPICTMAHAGVGTLHPIVVAPRDSAEIPANVRQAGEEIFELALRLGGTLTGEHGIGTLKREWLGRELGDGNLALQRSIKALLDPLNILNPGKAI